MAQLFSRNLVLNPLEADRILTAMGKGVIFDGAVARRRSTATRCATSGRRT